MGAQAWVYSGAAWKQASAAWTMKAGAWKQVKHAWKASTGPDPNNLGSSITEWLYAGSYVAPENPPSGAIVESTNPQAVMDPVGVKGGWTVPASDTVEYYYDVFVKFYNDSSFVAYQPSAVPSTAGSITVSAEDLNTQTGTYWYNTDDVYAEIWYVNNIGSGPIARAPATGYW